MSETFCPIPWNFQAIRSNGDLRVCCQANISEGQGLLKKSDNTPYNAESDDLTESRNSDLIKSVRRDMIKGNWNPSCVRCKQEEDAGLNSRRTYERERWDLTLDEALKATSSDGTIDTDRSPVTFYDFRFGNLCNLKCRMCGPTDSSAWLEDWAELTDSNHFHDTHGKVEILRRNDRPYTKAYDWHTSETFWAQLETKMDKINHVYMAGGEPLLIKRHYDFLEKCVNQGMSQSITLEYNTNCTQLPNKVLELWSQFKSVWVGASIDGYGDFAEYQRHPSRWPQIYDNLKKLNDQPKNITSWLAFTVTTYNIFHMVDFMKWKLTNPELKNINRTQRRPIITHHVAHNPRHLNIRVLPDELKAHIDSEFKNFIHWVDNRDFPEHVRKNAKQITDSVSSYMHAQSYHEDQWEKFCDYTQKLDKIRGESILNLIPTLKGHYRI